MANLAMGLADSYTEIGPRALTIWRGMMWEEFLQDSWKATSKLHIDFGFRVTTTQGFHALWGNSDYFNGTLYNPAQAVQVDAKTGNVILGTGNPYNGVIIPGFTRLPHCRRWACSGGNARYRQPVRWRTLHRLVQLELLAELHRQHHPVPAAHRYRVSRPIRRP